MNTSEVKEKLRKLADLNGDNMVSFADVRFELDKLAAKIDASKVQKHLFLFYGFVAGFSLCLLFVLMAR